MDPFSSHLMLSFLAMPFVFLVIFLKRRNRKK